MTTTERTIITECREALTDALAKRDEARRTYVVLTEAREAERAYLGEVTMVMHRRVEDAYGRLCYARSQVNAWTDQLADLLYG